MQMHGQPSNHAWSKYGVDTWSMPTRSIIKPMHYQMRMHCQHYQINTKALSNTNALSAIQILAGC
jgi:hypothetical protein